MDNEFEFDNRGKIFSPITGNSSTEETDSKPQRGTISDAWLSAIAKLVEERQANPFLTVMHVFAPAEFDRVSKTFRVITGEDRPSFNLRKVIPMTAFIRTGDNGETIFGLQQKFYADVDKNTFVHFAPDMHYSWGGKKQLTTLTLRLGSPSPKVVREQIYRLVQEASSFSILYAKN